MNPQAYLDRIGYTGSLEPTFAVLKDLQKAHLLHIPFENLDIHAGVYIKLDLERIFKKLVANGRGGFCYELNSLFYQLLTSLEFNVAMISARPFSRQEGYRPEFDHLSLLVSLEGAEYLVDVGFGEFSMAPLKIEMDLIQNDERGGYVLEQYDQKYIRVSRVEKGERIPEYLFSKVKRQLQDFEGMCHYHQTDLRSHFRTKKLITLPTPQGRITLTEDKLKIREGNSTTEVALKGGSSFVEALSKYFNFHTNLFQPLNK